MTQKINRCLVIGVWLLVIGLLVYSRFINLGWGLPYPMHPDERNMASAIQGLNCEFTNLKECFNPHFFAYGQFPLYLGYILVFFLKFFDGDLGFPVNFQEAAISLRIISSIASIINVFVLVKIVKLIIFKFQFLGLLMLIFSPFFIQFSHFGTTESLLMLFYSLIIYYSLKLLTMKQFNNSTIFYLSLFSGLALATKISSIIFITVPLITILSCLRSWDRYKNIVKFCLLTIIFAIIFSPHNLINYRDFISAFRYESAVATGQLKVFYTRQFEGTIAYLFQAVKVFPYVLGWPVYILSLLGFILLSWKNKYLNLIRLAILVYFVPSGYLFAKWSRFTAPILPLMLVFTILFIEFLILNFKFLFKSKFLIFNFLITAIVVITIIPGIRYLSIYQKPDVRFQASEWIYKNIPNNSTILSETANVVDIPISNGTMKQSNIYNVISFDFYNLDGSPSLQTELQNDLALADYIFVPSRRIFANNPKNKYPLLNSYYEKLFSSSCHPERSEGSFCFKKVAEFSAGLNDESAEETWTVFDHPVIRIYKKIKVF